MDSHSYKFQYIFPSSPCIVKSAVDAYYKDLRVVATMFKKELVAHIKDQHKTVANSIRDLEALEPFLTVALQSDPYQRQKYQVEDFSSVKFQKVLKRFVPEGKEREISEELIKYKELLPVLALNPPPNREEIASYSAAKKLALAKQRDPAGWWKLNRDVLPVLSAAFLKLFAIVPSTAGAERSHAQTKLLISAQQTRMDPNLINMMRVIKHNLKFFYPSLAEDDVDEDEDD